MAWMSPGKTQLPRAFSRFSIVFHSPPSLLMEKEKTRRDKEVIKAAPREPLVSTSYRGLVKAGCEAALSHALALGSPSTQQGVARTSI